MDPDRRVVERRTGRRHPRTDLVLKPRQKRRRGCRRTRDQLGLGVLRHGAERCVPGDAQATGQKVIAGDRRSRPPHGDVTTGPESRQERPLGRCEPLRRPQRHVPREPAQARVGAQPLDRLVRTCPWGRAADEIDQELPEVVLPRVTAASMGREQLGAPPRVPAEQLAEPPRRSVPPSRPFLRGDVYGDVAEPRFVRRDLEGSQHGPREPVRRPRVVVGRGPQDVTLELREEVPRCGDLDPGAHTVCTVVAGPEHRAEPLHEPPALSR